MQRAFVQYTAVFNLLTPLWMTGKPSSRKKEAIEDAQAQGSPIAARLLNEPQKKGPVKVHRPGTHPELP